MQFVRSFSESERKRTGRQMLVWQMQAVVSLSASFLLLRRNIVLGWTLLFATLLVANAGYIAVRGNIWPRFSNIGEGGKTLPPASRFALALLYFGAAVGLLLVVLHSLM